MALKDYGGNEAVRPREYPHLGHCFGRTDTDLLPASFTQLEKNAFFFFCRPCKFVSRWLRSW